MIDVNVSLARWPFRRLALDEPAALVDNLRARGVEQAWTGSLDALLHEDLAAVNARLADDCRKHGSGLLIPFGAVSPALPDWREDVRRCHEVHRMPGIRLHPDFHGYTAADPEFQALLAESARRELVVQLAVRMEDARTLHPRLSFPVPDLKPLVELVPRIPGLKLVVLNASAEIRSQAAADLAALGVGFDTAMIDGIGCLAQLIPTLGVGRLLFGSLSPLFPFEANALKLRESDLTDAQRESIVRGNARTILAP